MWPCSHQGQGLLPESTRFKSAEHLIGSSYNGQKANEIFHNLSSCKTRSINELVSRAILHKWQLMQLMIDDYIQYCVFKMPTWHWQAISAPTFMCTNTKSMRPRVSKELSLSRLISYPYGILLLHFTSNTSLLVDIQDYFLKYHGHEFIFKNERNRLDRKGKITFMIFVSVQIYSMCWNWFLWGCQCKESKSGISCLLYVLQTGMAVQQGHSWTRESTV